MNNLKELEIKYLQNVEKNRKHHLWYGGDVAEIKVSDNLKFIISAIGDVIADIYQEGKYKISVKDKYNYANFADEVSGYINSDEELERYITKDYVTDDYLKENKDKEYIVALDNNNWWECSADINGQIIDLMWCLDADYIDEAINEVLDEIKCKDSMLLSDLIVNN